jgi:hypothetical protein
MFVVRMAIGLWLLGLTACSGSVTIGETDGGAATGQTDAGVVPDNANASRRVIFVSSVSYSANLGGLDGADAKCQGLAQVAGLPGTFKAWLSDKKTAARDRLTHADVPYKLVDGTVIAKSWAELTSGTLAHGIYKTEKGSSPPAQQNARCYPSAWTFTDQYGGIENMGDCKGWTDTEAEAVAVDAGTGTVLGFPGSTYPTWTEGCWDTLACSFTAPLYCIEQ